jgi:hypothetical protein
MEASQANHFDEKKSIQVIQEMLRVSQRKFHSDGILMIIWGWIMALNYLAEYFFTIVYLQQQLRWSIKIAFVVLIFAGLAYTIFYLLKQRKKVQTYIGISLRYVWFGMFFSLVLINLIQNNVLHEINFELQHPIFMVVIAFATVVTVGILRYRLLVGGGIVFALLALISSYLPLSIQLLLESVAWMIAFIIPGHILYSKRKQ